MGAIKLTPGLKFAIEHIGLAKEWSGEAEARGIEIGRQDGIEIGRQDEIEIGEQRNEIRMVKSMFERGYTVADIATILDIPIETIQ